MRFSVRGRAARVLVPAALALVAPLLTACEADQSVVHLLLADDADPRWSEVAVPGFERRVEERCDGCVVRTSSADGRAGTQADQLAAALDDGADVVVLDAVDPEEAESWLGSTEDVPVVAWDRPVAGADYFVGVEPGAVGDVLVDALGDARTGRTLVLDAPEGDRDAAAVLAEGRPALTGRSDVVAAPTTAEAERVVADRVRGSSYDAVLASTDAQAAGAAAALDGRDGAPAVVGPDAGLETARRLVDGSQQAAAYVPWHRMATRAADVTVPLLTGGTVRGGRDVDGTRSWVLEPEEVTLDTLTSTMVRDGAIGLSALCGGALRTRCTSLGLL